MILANIESTEGARWRFPAAVTSDDVRIPPDRSRKAKRRWTWLPIAEVALASGFGSIRRFNEVFHGLYRRSPTALRGSAGGVTTGSHGEVGILLRYRPPYDWPAMLAFLQARAIPGVEWISGDRYARTLEIEAAHGVVVVRPAAGDALKAAIRFPRLSALPAIIARLRRVFDLTADPHAIGAQLAEDSILAPLVAARPGLRVPGAWDGFEQAVRAVLAQKATVQAVAGHAANLVVRYGERLAGPNATTEGLTHLFPCPERLASANLATLPMPRRRAQELTSLAAAFARDPGILGEGRDPVACMKRLRTLAGIGERTARYIAMREWVETDAFPHSVETGPGAPRRATTDFAGAHGHG